MSSRSLLEDRLFGDGFFTATLAAPDGDLVDGIEFRWGLDVYHATSMDDLLLKLEGIDEKGWVEWHLSRWRATIEIKKGDDALMRWIDEQDEEDTLVDGDWEID